MSFSLLTREMRINAVYNIFFFFVLHSLFHLYLTDIEEEYVTSHITKLTFPSALLYTLLTLAQ